LEQNPHLYAKDVERVVSAILDRMAGALADGDRVELRDFSTFAARDREARTSRNPRSGESVIVSAKRTVHFKPSKAMWVRLNLEKIAPEDETNQLLGL
jgi:integration host factor subunit beta